MTSMRSRFAIALVPFAISFAVGLVLGGCATVPKPQELLDLEGMRQAASYQDAVETQPELVQQSDEAHANSVEAWEDDELGQAKHWALLGMIKLRMALAMMGTEMARQQAAATKKELSQVNAKRRKLAAKIQETEEQLELVDQLSAARQAARATEAKLKAELSEVQQREAAQKKMGDAELALKLADTVEAKLHAESAYKAAQSLMQKAHTALKANNFTEAMATAQLAKSKADEAHSAARSLYMAAKKDAQRKTMNQALQRDASSISGIRVEMKSEGHTQQLIMPVVDIARRPNATLRGTKMPLLTAIGELLKKYPDYPVLVNGYTSYRVRRSQRFAVSQARAQQVAAHFATMGVQMSRMAVGGHGADELIGRKRARINDRVEVIILFH